MLGWALFADARLYGCSCVVWRGVAAGSPRGPANGASRQGGMHAGSTNDLWPRFELRPGCWWGAATTVNTQPCTNTDKHRYCGQLAQQRVRAAKRHVRSSLRPSGSRIYIKIQIFGDMFWVSLTDTYEIAGGTAASDQATFNIVDAQMQSGGRAQPDALWWAMHGWENQRTLYSGVCVW